MINVAAQGAPFVALFFVISSLITKQFDFYERRFPKKIIPFD